MPSSQVASSSSQENITNAIHINIPRRVLILPSVCGLAGLSLGFIKGSRAEGMRFLAENAHRPPTTVRGWYLYKKTKNYRMLWGGLSQGGREALQLGVIGAGFAAAEEGMSRVGLAEAREAGAGMVTALAVCAVYRVGWLKTRRAVLLGVVVGGWMSMLRRFRFQDRTRARAGEVS